MFNSKIKDFQNIQQIFADGKSLWFACLTPHYNWFDKTFKIQEIILPVKTEIKTHTIIPSQISNVDRQLINKLAFYNIARKFDMVVYLKTDISFKAQVYENRDKEMIIIYENNIVIADNKTDVCEAFFKNVICIKAEINFDDVALCIIDDENFALFRDIYNAAVEKYPEEVIRTHGGLK